MKQEAFDNLEFIQQQIVLLSASFISKREYYNHVVYLYSLHDYLVEVHYSPDNNQIDKIESVKDDKVLPLYVSDKQLLELL